MKGQPTLWNIEEPEEKITTAILGEEYPWRYHELFQFHKARNIHPVIAAVIAADELALEEKAAAAAERHYRPTLWEAA